MQGQAQTIGIAVFVVCIMISVGLDLRLSQIVAALRHPGRLAAAMGFNHLVMPAVALGWATAFGQPEAVITVVTRDGQSLTEADRDAAIALARALCIQSGREFSSTTRGHWLNDGGLGFHGACTR